MTTESTPESFAFSQSDRIRFFENDINNRISALENQRIPELINQINGMKTHLSSVETSLKRLQWILVASALFGAPIGTRVVDSLSPKMIDEPPIVLPNHGEAQNFNQ